MLAGPALGVVCAVVHDLCIDERVKLFKKTKPIFDSSFVLTGLPPVLADTGILYSFFGCGCGG